MFTTQKYISLSLTTQKKNIKIIQSGKAITKKKI